VIHWINFSGILSVSGKRHCISVAILAPNNSPSTLSITVEVASLKSGLGNEK
jgi:hypothetical protein